MGMGYASCFDWTVDEDKVKQMCEEEYRIVDELLKKYGESWRGLAYTIRFGDQFHDLEDEESEDIFFSFDQLVKRFKEKTDLTLVLSYHNQDDDGQRYDEVDGHFFTVLFQEVFELTPVAKKAKEKGIDIRLKTYVTYG